MATEPAVQYTASRMALVKPSAAAVVSQNAKAMKAAGHDVIDLGLGEPDFDTPKHIIDAAYAAALDGQTRYTATDGTADLKAALIRKFKRDNDLPFEAHNIIVSTGAKQVIFNALMATLEPEQEVMVCAPYFGVYEDMVLILGGKPVALPCSADNQFRLMPDVLEASITAKTRWLILNLPSNPAGAVYSEAQLQELSAVLKKHHHVMVLSDEIYEHILFDNRKFRSFASACPDLAARVLTVNGVSKAYAMTGWRIGYGAGPQALIAAMTKVQSQITSGASSVSQAAAVAALDGPQDDVERFREAFERRRNLIVRHVKAIDGLTLDPPGGAFYAYIGCAALIGATRPNGEVVRDDQALAQFLLDDANVAAVPGSAYGLSPFFRISTATSDDELDRAMRRIAASVAKLDGLTVDHANE